MNIEKILPGFGFIGCGSTSCVVVKHNANKKIKRLRLELSSHKPVDLNLKQIRFYDENGQLIKIDEKTVQCSQSSWRLDKRKSSYHLIAGKTIHTAKENNPHWEVVFSQSQKISKIVIENRRSKLGIRTNSLKVISQYEGASRTFLIYDNLSLKNLNDFFNLLNELEIKFDLFDGQSDIEKRSKLLKEVNAALLKNKENFLKINLKSANYLLNIWHREKNEFSEDEIQLLSLILLRDHKSRNAAKNYSLILNKKEYLNVCQEKLSENGKLILGAEYILTKHGLSRNILQENSEKFIRAARKLSDDLYSLGYPTLLCYGTLLGAYRDHEFIKNDDDLDMLYITDAKSQEEVLPIVNIVKNKLENLGYICDIRDTNMHVMHNDSRTQLDIFPCWIRDNDLFLHMENMKYRSISKDIILPLNEIEFKGTKFNCPNDCEAFFSERYHEGWNVYDPYHEWPWDLVD